jgi:DNA-binding transcriptional LysR family regulator
MAAALAATRVAQSRVLRISALPLFTSTWLIPRLAHFEAAHPGISIDIETTNRMVDLDTEPVDIAIRNVDAPTPGFDCHKLMDLRAVPLCTAAIASRVKGPADLAGETLIHISARRDSWPQWLAALGFAALQARAHVSFDTVPAALDAAAHGRGVMLGPGPLVLVAPQAQGLVVPFETPPYSAGAYFLIHRRRDRADARVRAFVTWMKRELSSQPAPP